MLAFKGPAQPSPTLGDALNAGYLYLEVRCLSCDTHQTVALDIVWRPKTTPIHELERYMRCKDCSDARGYPYKRRWRCGGLRFRRAIRRQRGGRESSETTKTATIVMLSFIAPCYLSRRLSCWYLRSGESR